MPPHRLFSGPLQQGTADEKVRPCTLLVFLALAVAVAGSRLANSDRMDEALRLSAISRWVYMLLFIIAAWASLAY